MAPHSCPVSFEQQVKYSLKITKVKGDEFYLRIFNPSTYDFKPNAVPSKVLSDPDSCELLHVKSAGPADMYKFALYADGACLGNGTPQAQAGFGVYGTPDAWYNQGYLLLMDVPQTSHSAEVHSAIAELKVARSVL